MISDETLQEEVSQTVKEYGERFQDFTESVHPWRIALSGLLLLLFIGGIFATWYWVIPRDSVTVETVYLQRSGHVMLVEVHNEGSRPITSVELSLQFLDNESDVLDSIVVNIDTIPAHTSVSGDDLELVMLGYSIWDENSIRIDLDWVDYSGVQHSRSWNHEIGEWAYEKFSDSS